MDCRRLGIPGNGLPPAWNSIAELLTDVVLGIRRTWLMDSHLRVPSADKCQPSARPTGIPAPWNPASLENPLSGIPLAWNSTAVWNTPALESPDSGIPRKDC